MNLQEKYDEVVTPGKASVASDDHARFVESRYYAMSYAKNPIRDIWQGTNSLYYVDDWKWIVSGDSFDAPVRFTTLRDLEKALVDKFTENPPAVVLEAVKKYQEDIVIGKKAYMEQVMSSPREKRIRRQVIQDMFHYGHGFRDYGYYDIYKDYGEKTPRNLFKGIATRRLDPRSTFVDETANILYDELRENGARDMIIRHTYAPTTFAQMFADPKYKIAGVVAESYMSTQGMDYLATTSREVTEKTNVNVVKVYEYMNQEEDIYSLVANGSTIYKGSLLECRGTTQIPVVAWQFEPRNDSFWGDTLASIVAGHIYLKDTILNLEIMNLKLTLQPVLAVSGEFGYNPRTHIVQPGGVWVAGSMQNGKLADNIQPVIAGNSNTNAYPMLDKIAGEMAIASRSDIRTLENQPGRTASEFMGQQSSMNIHNETIESNIEIEAEAIGYQLTDQIMRQFMQVKGDDAGDRMLKISIRNYKAHQSEGANPKFIAKSGHKDMFDLTDDIINADVLITVVDKRTDKVNKLEKIGRIAQGLPIIGNLAQLDPEALKMLNIPGMIEQYIEALDFDVVRSFRKSSDYEDQFEMLKDEILLGNKVDLNPAEKRRDSLARLSFMGSLITYLGDEIKPEQKSAWSYHYNQVVQNIVRNHMSDLSEEVDPTKMQQTMQQMGQTASGQQAINNGNMAEGANGGMNMMGSNTISNVNNIPGPDDAIASQFNSVKPAV